jgi:hypothetical protein
LQENELGNMEKIAQREVESREAGKKKTGKRK